MADDPKYRYTFEDDANFATQVTADTGSYNLTHQATEGFGLTTVAAAKVADGSSSAAQLTVGVGEAAFYANPDLSDGIGASDSFSVLAKVKLSAALTANHAGVRAWVYYDVAGTAPEKIDFQFIFADGAMKLKAGIIDVDTNEIATSLSTEGLFFADTYMWVAAVLNRGDDTLKVFINRDNIGTTSSAIIGEILVGVDASIPMQGFYSIGAGSENQPVFTISDIRVFDRVISGGELVGDFSASASRLPQLPYYY